MATKIDISEYLSEYHAHGEIVLRAKWAMDGAESLAEAAQLLRHFADEVDELAAAGFHLMGPVEDDYGFAHRGDDVEVVSRPHDGRQRRGLQQINEPEAVPPITACRASVCAGATASTLSAVVPNDA